jgi:hypothetical protein
MMCHGDDLDQSPTFEIDNAERKFVKKISTEAPMNAGPTLRCLGDVLDRSLKRDQKRISNCWIASMVPSAGGLCFFGGKWENPNPATSHAGRA